MSEHIHRQRRGIYPLYSTELKKGVINQPNPSYRHWETTKSTSPCNFGQELFMERKAQISTKSNILCSTGIINPNTIVVKEKITEKRIWKTKKGEIEKKEQRLLKVVWAAYQLHKWTFACSKASPSLPVLVLLKTSNKQLNILLILFPWCPKSLQYPSRSLHYRSF